MRAKTERVRGTAFAIRCRNLGGKAVGDELRLERRVCETGRRRSHARIAFLKRNFDDLHEIKRENSKEII